MYRAEELNGFWYVCLDGKTVGTWVVGRMPGTKEQCIDAAQRLNSGANITQLPRYQKSENMNRIVARAPWGDTYSAQDAEDGRVPSEAYEVEEIEG